MCSYQFCFVDDLVEQHRINVKPEEHRRTLHSVCCPRVHEEIFLRKPINHVNGPFNG